MENTLNIRYKLAFALLILSIIAFWGTPVYSASQTQAGALQDLQKIIQSADKNAPEGTCDYYFAHWKNYDSMPIPTKSGRCAQYSYGPPKSGKVINIVRNACNIALGRDCVYISGFRSRAYNECLRRGGIKAAKNSKHIEGIAVDFHLPPGQNTKANRAKVLRYVLCGLGKLNNCQGGLGLYSNQVKHIHVDVRQTKSTWGSSPYSSEKTYQASLRSNQCGANGFMQDVATETGEQDLYGPPDTTEGIPVPDNSDAPYSLDGNLGSDGLDTQTPDSSDSAAKDPTKDPNAPLPPASAGGMPDRSSLPSIQVPGAQAAINPANAGYDDSIPPPVDSPSDSANFDWLNNTMDASPGTDSDLPYDPGQQSSFSDNDNLDSGTSYNQSSSANSLGQADIDSSPTFRANKMKIMRAYAQGIIPNTPVNQKRIENLMNASRPNMDYYNLMVQYKTRSYINRLYKKPTSKSEAVSNQRKQSINTPSYQTILFGQRDVDVTDELYAINDLSSQKVPRYSYSVWDVWLGAISKMFGF